MSEPWMASAGVEPWMGSSTDEHFPRSTAGALFPNTAGKSIQALCVITVAGMARSYRSENAWPARTGARAHGTLVQELERMAR